MEKETLLLPARDLTADAGSIALAGRILREGGIVAIPTETVYGLAGNALDPGATAKIYAAKGRPSDNPLIVHIQAMEEWAPLVRELPKEAAALAAPSGPGPLPSSCPNRRWFRIPPPGGWTPWRCGCPPTPSPGG